MNLYLYDGDGGLRAVNVPAARPLRWAAWRPDGAWAMLAGNRGLVLRLELRGVDVAFAPMPTGSTHNLRGVGWAPDGERALLVGNRGAVLLYERERFRELESATVENLRRVAWAPDGSCALIAGNAGVVLRFDAAARTLQPVPGDRAHTMRSIAWRPDGAYALIGAYASRYAGYPRPHLLYRCDGRYTQALLATDDDDDALALDWRPGARPAQALALVVAYREDQRPTNKIFLYDGAGFDRRPIEAPATLLGAAWAPDGARALVCGERGTLLLLTDAAITPVASATRDNLIGPFWRPGVAAASALLLKGPDEKVFTA
ncbi:MAG: hypothetical protein IVW36_03315 [Dehalococcoidia bacterium]|nr:hypothetical protein [Dehalococcoidia bacterium]